jgi:hypothetical protein
MKARAIAAYVVVLTTVACAESVPPVSTATASVAGQFTLTGVDTNGNLPCCRQADSSGTVVTTNGGLLQIGWNTPTGGYEWDAVRSYRYSNGTSQTAQSQFSAGSFTWDGQTLTLVDSTGLGVMTGTRAGGRLTVRAFGHRYEFLELIQMPH